MTELVSHNIILGTLDYIFTINLPFLYSLTQSMSVALSSPFGSSVFTSWILTMSMPNIYRNSNPLCHNPTTRFGGSSIPLQGFPWIGGHIPPSITAIGSGPFQSNRSV